MIFTVTPCPAPRQVRSDKWKPRPQVVKYRSFRDEVRRQAKDWTPPAANVIAFFLPMPKSWSKAKKADFIGMPHQQHPDKDNLEKSFLDCFGEDKHIFAGAVLKFWAPEGEGQIEVYEWKRWRDWHRMRGKR